MAPILAPDGAFLGKASHEVLGEQYLRQLGFSEKICQLVGAHVMAKRYLTAVDADYYDGLSKSSKMTLKFQVSPCLLLLLQHRADEALGWYFRRAASQRSTEGSFAARKAASPSVGRPGQRSKHGHSVLE